MGYCIIIMCLMVACVRGQQKQETKLQVSAPLNPVKEGEMLSIHCQISNLEKEHSVILQRTVGADTETISLDETMQKNVDSRFFLAQRRLSGGQMVFFLSIIDVVREKDEGEYTCKIIDKNEFTKVIIGSVGVNVQFFPSEPSPLCVAQQQQMTVQSGSLMSFNCTSVDGSPPVDITWTKTGSAKPIKATDEGHADGIVYSSLQTVALMKYDGAVFICTISSDTFPDIGGRTCTVGPLKVIPDPLNPEPDIPVLNDDSDKETGGNKGHPISVPGIENDNNINDKQDMGRDMLPSTDCTDICSSLDSPAFYWIVATVVAAIFALLFLIIGIVIAIKLYHMTNNNQNNNVMEQSIYRQPLEGLYERLEYGREDLRDHDRMYMALHGLRKPDNLVVQTDYPLAIEGNYTRTPTGPLGITAPHGVLPLPAAPSSVLPGAPGGPCGPPEGHQTPINIRPISPNKLL